MVRARIAQSHPAKKVMPNVNNRVSLSLVFLCCIHVQNRLTVSFIIICYC